MLRQLSVLAGTALLGVLIGCSGFDSTQVLVHPDSLATSQTVNVAIVNLYTYLDTAGSVLSQDITRDSLHLMVGMPASWEVSEVKAAVVNDMNTSALLALQGKIVDKQSGAALLAQYEASATPLAEDDGVTAVLAGQTVDARSATGEGNTIPITVDDIAQTKGFSGPVDVAITKGSTADTTLALDSILAFVSGSGMVPDSTMESVTALLNYPLLKKPDSVGIVMVPVIIFMKLTAGTDVGDDTLVYFTKTAAMDQAPSPIIATIALLSPETAPMLSGIESGDMIFMPVSVLDESGTVRGQSGPSYSGVHITSDGMAGTVRIGMGSAPVNGVMVSVYSLQGALVTTLGAAQAVPGGFIWRGTDLSGRSVKDGTYVFRITGIATPKTFSVPLMR
jgi:hypothetical protein